MAIRYDIEMECCQMWRRPHPNDSIKSPADTQISRRQSKCTAWFFPPRQTPVLAILAIQMRSMRPAVRAIRIGTNYNCWLLSSHSSSIHQRSVARQQIKDTDVHMTIFLTHSPYVSL